MAQKLLAGPIYALRDLSGRVGLAFQEGRINGREALQYQVQAANANNLSSSVSETVTRAVNIQNQRQELHAINRGHKSNLVRSLARNPMHHFLQKRLSPLPETNLALKHETDFLYRLIGEISPETVLARVERRLAEKLLNPNIRSDSLTAAQYRDLLCHNQVPYGFHFELIKKLDGQENMTNQGAGLGSFCERRVGLALARLMDYGYIRNFTLFGAAKYPLIANDDKNKIAVDYHKGEEAMGIDAMVELDARQPYSYALLQVKANAPMGFKENTAKGSFSELSLTGRELDELIKLRPEVIDFYKIVPGFKDKFSIVVERNIFTVDTAPRKLQKTCYKDKSPDLVNFLLAAFEYMQDKYTQYYSELNLRKRAYYKKKGIALELEKPSLLVLDKPYESLSYPEKIAALVKSNFFKLVKEKP